MNEPSKFRFPHFIVKKDDARAGTFGSPPSGPAGFAPDDIKKAYGFDLVVGDGTGQTIAIIIPGGDNGNVESDLAFFSAFFGLPDPPVFTKVDQRGGTAYPAYDQGATVEMCLDVQWAHAIAPGANILLVECDTFTVSDLMAGIIYAASAGASVISMSWDFNEFFNEASFWDTQWPGPGVTFVAASGDDGTISWPSVSPKVLGVGGTLVTTDGSGNWSSETGWASSGGGISVYETQPTYQTGIVTQSSTKRCTPDVAYVGGQTFSVYNSEPPFSGWLGAGGTSAGTPQWAGLIAIVNQLRVAAGKSVLDGPSGTLPGIYSSASTNFHDITTGSTVSGSAGVGFDLVTGRGTPKANLLIPALAQVSPTVSRGNGKFVAGEFNTYYFYIANNTTFKLSPLDTDGNANSGEQINSDGGTVEFTGQAVLSNSTGAATIVTFSDATLIRPSAGLLVVAGKGIGQWARTVSKSGNDVTLDRKWRVDVDSTSTIVFGDVTTEWVIENNTLDGNNQYGTASVGVEFFMINAANWVRNNAVTDTRHGIISERFYSMHNLIEDSTLVTAQRAAFNGTTNIGSIYRNLTCTGLIVADWAALGSYTGAIFDHCSFTDAPIGLADYVPPGTHSGTSGQIAMYNTTFSLGTGTFAGSKAQDITGYTVILVSSSFTGFQS